MILGKKAINLTLSQTIPCFHVSAAQVLWKHWENEKLLVTSNFSFSHIFFNPFGKLSAIFIKLEIVVCKLLDWNSQKFVGWERVNPFPDDKILDWSKLKQIADHILKCIENEKYVPYRVENIVRKGEIACYCVKMRHCVLMC